MPVADVDLSRAIAHALRHEPWLYELELDREGWVPVDQLLGALREKGRAWVHVDRAALEKMLATATKQRYELLGDRIRALYGHSVPDKIVKTSGMPPVELFHGTAPATWELIQRDGLLPMGRQYVHLSEDVETATAVGRRKSPRPVILRIDARAAGLEGAKFFHGNETVWLADYIPAEFIRTLEV